MQKIILGYWFLPKKLVELAFFLLLTVGLNSCSHEEDVVSSKTGITKVYKAEYSSLSGWKSDDFAKVIPVFEANCAKILQNKKEFLADSKIKIETSAYQKVCEKFAKGIKNSVEMREFIESEFTPYAVVEGANPVGKFTSYYEAGINASYTKTEKFKYPVYGKPNDLVEINLRDFGTEFPNTRLVGRVENNKFVPYFNRKDIENKGINAPVLMWADDLVDVHIMQIQGSAIANMTDGTNVRIGYADNNGHKFRGIGSIMLEKKILKAGEVSMENIRKWLKKHPERAKELMEKNERFIFQRLVNASGPVGAFGLPLSAGRSIAVDNAIIPLGAMMWLDTVDADNNKLEKIVFAQDIGSAIKGTVRGDYFWGSGEQAFLAAGRMNSAGRYYIMVPKNSVIQVN